MQTISRTDQIRKFSQRSEDSPCCRTICELKHSVIIAVSWCFLLAVHGGVKVSKSWRDGVQCFKFYTIPHKNRPVSQPRHPLRLEWSALGGRYIWLLQIPKSRFRCNSYALYMIATNAFSFDSTDGQNPKHRCAWARLITITTLWLSTITTSSAARSMPNDGLPFTRSIVI